MEYIEALTYALILIALGLGIIAAFTLPIGQVLVALAVTFYLSFMYFSPLTSAWFSHTLVDQLGFSKPALAIWAAMVASFGTAAAATVVYNLTRGRIRGDGLPPAV